MKEFVKDFLLNVVAMIAVVAIIENIDVLYLGGGTIENVLLYNAWVITAVAFILTYVKAFTLTFINREK